VKNQLGGLLSGGLLFVHGTPQTTGHLTDVTQLVDVYTVYIRAGRELDSFMDWIGLEWIGLGWVEISEKNDGLDWIGLDWIGLDWVEILEKNDGLDWIGLGRNFREK